MGGDRIQPAGSQCVGYYFFLCYITSASSLFSLSHISDTHTSLMAQSPLLISQAHISKVKLPWDAY